MALWWFTEAVPITWTALLSLECEKEKENEKKAKDLKFSRVEDTGGWIRAHKAEVALGAVGIIAGAVFAITIGGSGALILAPLFL